jgi:hypothetical protein
MSASDALAIPCVSCGSKRISTYDKEIEIAWSFGLRELASYRRAGKESFKECKCMDCGKKFRYFPSSKETTESTVSEEHSELLGKSVRLRTPQGQVIQAQIDAIDASANVNAGTPSAVTATDQFMIRVKATRMETTEGPMLVLNENDAPIGILWASGTDDQANIIGIVQPITRLAPRVPKL